MAWRCLAAAILTLSCAQASADQPSLNIPRLQSGRASVFRATLIGPFLHTSDCTSLLSAGAFSAWNQTKLITDFSNQNFERRGWSADFLAERLPLAWKYRHRSQYVALTRATGSSELVASVGLSWTTYTAASIPAAESRITSAEVSSSLPGELSLGARPFPRPLSTNGQGIVFELRTWAIAKDGLSAEERGEAFGTLLSHLLPMVFEKIEHLPDLYDQSILYTYGDKTSLKLYGMMGFENISATPIHHEGADWWILAISPKGLEALVSRMKSPAFIYDLNQELEVNLPQGRFKVQATRGFGHDGAVYTRHAEGPSGEPRTIIENLAYPTTLSGDISLLSGSNVVWSEDGGLEAVTGIMKPHTMEPGIVAGVGSSIAKLKANEEVEFGFNEKGDLFSSRRSIHQSQRPARFERELKYIKFLAIEAEMARGLWAAEGSAVAWTTDRSTLLIKELGRSGSFTVSGVRLRAAQGSSLHIDPWRVVVSQIVNRLRLPNGKWIEPGKGLEIPLKSNGTANWSKVKVL